MAFNNPFTNCQTYSSTRIVFPSMKTLEYDKYSFHLFVIYSDTIVLY